MNIKYENIFLILYIGATFTKYAVTSNADIIALIISVIMDYLLGLIFYRLIKAYRQAIKEDKKRSFPQHR